jgi:hypothetical protein
MCEPRLDDRPVGALLIEIRLLLERLDSIFAKRNDWARAMLFRVSRASAPSAYSLKRDLNSVFRDAVTSPPYPRSAMYP